MPYPSAPTLGQPNGVVLDDRVGEQRLGHLLGLLERGLLVARLELELDVLADPQRGGGREAEARQRVRDRLPLRVQDLRLEHHIDDDLYGRHARTLPATTAAPWR